jgi:hypothetical protein
MELCGSAFSGHSHELGGPDLVVLCQLVTPFRIHALGGTRRNEAYETDNDTEGARASWRNAWACYGSFHAQNQLEWQSCGSAK